MVAMTFSAAQTNVKTGVGERYLPKRVGLAAKIETPKEVSPHDFLVFILRTHKPIPLWVPWQHKPDSDGGLLQDKDRKVEIQQAMQQCA